MRIPIAIVGLATLLSVSAAGWQQPPALPERAGPALRGAVSTPDGAPVPGVLVAVFPQSEGEALPVDEPARLQQATTSASGAFEFANLPPGGYRLAVADAAALTTWPDAGLLSRLASSAVPVQVSAADSVTLGLVVSPESGVRRVVNASMSRARTELEQPGARRGAPGTRRGPLPVPRARRPGVPVTGTVSAGGVPVVGATVALLIPRTVNGTRLFARLGAATTTSETGAYELTAPPGSYLIVVFGEGTGPGGPGGRHVASPGPAIDPEGRARILTTTFYPSALRTAEAETVRVTDGGLERMDLEMQWRPAARVTGMIRPAVGRLPAFTRLVLRPIDAADEIGGPNVRWTEAGPDGSFELAHVPTGAYVVSVQAGPAGWASQHVSIGFGNVKLDIDLQAHFTISGRVEFRQTGRAERPGDPGALTVQLEPAIRLAGTPLLRTKPDPDGRFEFGNVPGGRYRLQATTTEGWIQSSGMLNGIETLDRPLGITSDQDDGLIVMVDQDTAVLGFVTDARGQPVREGRVVVFSTEPKDWASGTRRVRILRLSPGGTFTVSGLPAGTYLVTWLPDGGQPVTYQGLASLAAGATTFVLLDGEQKQVRLTVK